MYIRSYAVQCKKEMFSENRYRLICFLFESVVKVNDVFIDIGANIGLCSAAALRTPDVQLIAVEPGTQFRNILKRSLPAITAAERAKIITHPDIPLASQRVIFSQSPTKPRHITSHALSAAMSATLAVDACAKFIMEGIASVKPDILGLNETHMELIQRKVPSSFLSRIRVLIIDMPPKPYANDDGTTNAWNSCALPNCPLNKIWRFFTRNANQMAHQRPTGPSRQCSDILAKRQAWLRVRLALLSVRHLLLVGCSFGQQMRACKALARMQYRTH